MLSKNQTEVVRALRAMNYLATCINDEEIFFGSWLTYGIADGDIEMCDEDLFEEYGDSDILKSVIGCFLRCMAKAGKNGGLYIGNVVADIEDF